MCRHKRCSSLLAVAALVSISFIAGLSGCRSFDVTEQRLLSKSNMLFSNPRAFTYDTSLTLQIERGASAGNSSQAASCPTCK